MWRSTNPVEKLLIASAANGGVAFASGCWFHITVFAQTSVPDYRLRFTTSYSSTEHGGSGRADTARQSSAMNGTQSSGNSQHGDHHNDDDENEGGDSTRTMRATDLAERMRANLRLLKEDAYARDQLETRVRRRLDEQRAQRREKAERAAAKAAANARVRDEAVQKLLSRGHGGSGKRQDVAESGGAAVPTLEPEADLAIALQMARGDFTARNRMPTSFAPRAIEVCVWCEWDVCVFYHFNQCISKLVHAHFVSS